MYYKPLLIGEIGLSHEGSVGNAIALIDLALKYNLDFIKFQDHWADYESSFNEKMRVESLIDKNRYDYWQRTEFSFDEWQIIHNYLNTKNIKFCCSVFSPESFYRQRSLGNNFWKLGSGEMLNNQLMNILKKELNTQDTLIISTGLAELDSVLDFAKDFINKVREIFVLDCVSMYPSNIDDYQISRWQKIKDYNKAIKFGLSDHTGSIWPSIFSWNYGSLLNEIHITFDKNMYGPDQKSSLDPKQLKLLNEARDNFQKLISNSELSRKNKYNEKMRTLFGRSIGFKHSLKAGHEIKEEDIQLRKPANGINPNEISNIIGKVLARDYNYLELLQKEDLK